jgi:nitrite reductase/ring-hydroxylating ferredoxin subunit
VTTFQIRPDVVGEQERAPRSPAVSIQEYLDHDSRPVPDVLRYDRNDDLGTESLSVDRYISQDWHDREVQKVWRKAWQFVCRTDHIPEIGDHYIYEIGDDNLIVVRTGPQEIKAYYNACLHRGRLLRTNPGRVSEFRCPFHGMSWNLDGTNLEWMGDENIQYDVIASENWNRQIVPQGVPSPTVAAQLTEQEVLDSYYETRQYYQAGVGRDLSVGEGGTPRVPEGSTARAVLAQAQRDALSAQFGRPFDHWTDSELLDGIQYFVFPNFYVFAGPRTNAVYRFRPDGNSPDSCIADVLLLAQAPAEGVERAKPKPQRWLQPGETFSDITEIGLLGPVFDQDYANLPHIQKGLKTTRAKGVLISRYQENRIRHYHQILEAWMAR